MKRKIPLFGLLAVILPMVTGCGGSSGPKSSIEPVDIQKSFSFSSNFEDWIKKHIIEDEAFASADILLFNFIKPDSVTNPFLPGPKAYSKVAAYIEWPSKFESVIFDNTNLALSVTFLSNIHFTIPSGWNFESRTYGKEYKWQFATTNKESAVYPETMCYSLHPARVLAYEDSIGLDNGFTLSWGNAFNKDDIFIDFSFEDNLARKEFSGVATQDNGSYTFENGYLRKLGINKAGTLIINILRLKQSFNNLSFTDTGILKIVSYSITTAKVTIYIKV